MKQLLFGALVILFMASCSTEKPNDYYVQEIIRLEQLVNEVEYERDMYKAKLDKYEASDYLTVPDTNMDMSISSIQSFVRFYPN